MLSNYIHSFSLTFWNLNKEHSFLEKKRFFVVNKIEYLQRIYYNINSLLEHLDLMKYIVKN